MNIIKPRSFSGLNSKSMLNLIMSKSTGSSDKKDLTPEKLTSVIVISGEENI